MAKTKCEICNRTFKNQNGLDQHNSDKHPKPVKNTKAPKNAKKLGAWLTIIVLIGLFAWGVSFFVGDISECKTMSVTEMNIGGHNNLVSHIHADLKIIIDGAEQVIPTNVGVLPGVMRPTHTHDSTGHIHIEGTCPRDFLVGDFFQVWNKGFDQECIFDKCTDSGTIEMRVNGKDNLDFENYIMGDGDLMVIEYNSNGI